jgi:hypothetical protein
MGVAAVCGSGDYQYAPPGGRHAYHGQPARTQRDASGCVGEDKTGNSKAGDAAYPGSAQSGNTKAGRTKAGDPKTNGKTGNSQIADKTARPGNEKA